jgi:hypothetical protein
VDELTGGSLDDSIGVGFRVATIPDLPAISTTTAPSTPPIISSGAKTPAQLHPSRLQHLARQLRTDTYLHRFRLRCRNVCRRARACIAAHADHGNASNLLSPTRGRLINSFGRENYQQTNVCWLMTCGNSPPEFEIVDRRIDRPYATPLLSPIVGAKLLDLPLYSSDISRSKRTVSSIK